MADYGNIGGNLSFRGGGGDYKSAYAASLAMNQQNYANILSGYNQTMQSQQNAQGRIRTGYQNLQGQVLGSIAGIDRSQRQDIADTYAKNVGTASQDLINRGLGNSTVQSAIGRGLLYDKAKSDIALTNATQGLNAQYMSQLGLAGLNYDAQAAQQNTGWAGKQLDFMNSVNAGYPDPRTYAMLAQMKGQSAMGGGGLQGGVPGSSGSVKSPLGGGGGYPQMGGVSYGNSFGTGGVRAPTPYSGAPETLTPEADANWWDLGGTGSSRFDLSSSAGGGAYAYGSGAGAPAPQWGEPGFESGAGGNQGGGGFFDPWADENQ